MIRILPEHVINQIAAGEVVERPASIVKELIENSLDAKADHIVINLRNGGKGLIRISDNGTGIAPEELDQAVLRHATSKIAKIEDLDHVLTLGFRGEALASIASVSQMYLESKTSTSNSASTITMDHGRIENKNTAAREQGTTVNIENLFAKIPARRKFLKSDRQELAVIVRLIQEIALANPAVHFELNHNGQELLNTPPRKSLLEKFYDIFPSPDLPGKMMAIEQEENGLKLQAIISQPIIKRASKGQQMVAVNQRTIRDYRINKTIEDAYHTFLLSSEHPIFFLHLSVNPQEIDVNVHPRKNEVRFEHLDHILSFIYRSVKGTLEKQILSVNPSFNSKFEIPNAQLSPTSNFEFRTSHSPSNSVASPSNTYQAAQFNQLFTEETPPRPIKVVSQIKNSYILCTAEQSLILFDQHAAHERFIYEELKKTRAQKSTQQLMNPLELTATAEQSILLAEQQQNFANFGIQLEQSGPNNWLITDVPNMPRSYKIDWSQVVLNSLDQVHAESLTHSLQDHEDDILHTMACKAAVKFNDHLSLSELQRLIDDVAYLPGIYTCPHGRPFRLELTFNELDRYFKRH
ncbi:MAG: DNA mismatch repair endonuclease MutL [Candidatus Abawacabacteria bacterium]|nr:DNA mismatch repair endonuclease MutL [Candidatus Abawacabacteria bacterium]